MKASSVPAPTMSVTSPSYSPHSRDSLTGMVQTAEIAQRLVVDATLEARTESAMPATDNDRLLPFSLPSICKKKVTAAFDGGLISSDGGVLLLAGADRQLGLIDTLAAIIPDHRNPDLITHSMADILRARVFAIACGYPDADDLRKDPAFKLACGRLPESGDDLASQPTMSRWENAPDLRTLMRLTRAMVELWCKSYRRAPKSITLDIDDTADTVHGHQQLSLFNAHYDERCFLPIHVYDVDTGDCVLTILRPGEDARWQGSKCPSTSTGEVHPGALAAHAHHHSRRQSLWPARSDGVVRE
jgi:hypothetical protein